MGSPSGAGGSIGAGTTGWRPSDEFLDALAQAVASLGAARGGVPFAAARELARQLPGGAALTVDFGATRRIGAPLVLLRPAAPHADVLAPLTARQRDVARLLAAGRTNKAIARALGLTLGTVKDHVHQILVRSGHPNRASFAAAMAGRLAFGHRADSGAALAPRPSILG